MTRGRFALLGAALAVALLVAVLWARSKGPAAPAHGDPPLSLLLVTIDTLRADHLGCYGDGDASTPAIDRLAAEGVLFEQASTCVPVTLPSHASILTGTYPVFHGVRNNGAYRLDDAALTLAEILRGRGWRTGAVIAAYPLLARFGLAQGFDTYDDALPPERERQIGYREKSAEEVSRAGLDFLAKDAEPPFFLWLHYFDPHIPYAPPEPFAGRFRGKPYDGEIAFVDEQIGRVLERIRRPDLASRTLVVLMSDHGEGLGEHGEWTHGVFLYESTLRVPLMMALPGVLPAGRRVATPVSSIDVLPTVLDLLRVPVPDEVQGESLRPLFEGSAAAPRVILAESEMPRENYGWSGLAAIREGGLKLIRAPRRELYDLSADPHEAEDRSSARPEEAARLAADLDRRLTEATRAALDGSGRQEPDEETRKRLASLGYILSPGPARRAPLPDPKDRIAVLDLLDQGRVLAADGKLAEAIATYTRALGADPGNPTVYERRGNARLASKDFRGAQKDYAKVLGSHPDHLEALQNMGSALLGQGDLEGAADHFSRVLALAPDSPRTLTSLGIVRYRQGRPDEARPLFKRALALEPDSPQAREWAAAGEGPAAESPGGTPTGRAPIDQARSLYEAGRFQEIVTLADGEIRDGRDAPDLRFVRGNALFRLGKVEDAAADYRRVLEARPDDVGALFGLALVDLRQGKTAAAMRRLEQAKRIDPRHPDVARNLAILYDEAGRTGDAITSYESALALAPDALELRFFLGRALAKAGRKSEARSQFQAYLDGGGTEYRDAARSALAGLKP